MKRKIASIGAEPQLVVDDLLIQSMEGVRRRLHPGGKLPEHVLEPDQPWEGVRVYVYGTTTYDADEGLFKMWYLARMGPGFEERSPGLLRQGDVMLYATSLDGIQWEKPRLGLKEFDGSRDNNIVRINCHSPTIFVDEDAPPVERYRYLGWNNEEGQERGYLAAHSADGLRWVEYPGNPVIRVKEVVETMTVTRHPETKEFFGYHRRWVKCEGDGKDFGDYRDWRRGLAVTRSQDFVSWSPPSMILTPDEEDDAWAQNPGERGEFYNLSGFRYGSQFLGFLPLFRITSVTPRASDSAAARALGANVSPWDGPIEAQLVHSRDGVLWNRFEDRSPIIPRGQPGSFDAGMILAVADRPIIVGDEVWVYYTGINTTHGGTIPPKRAAIGRASWRLDGFVSLQGGRTVASWRLFRCASEAIALSSMRMPRREASRWNYSLRMVIHCPDTPGLTVKPFHPTAFARSCGGNRAKRSPTQSLYVFAFISARRISTPCYLHLFLRQLRRKRLA